MRKRKNGERRFARRLLRLIVLVTFGFVFILSLPTIYAFVMYYHVGYIEGDSTGWWYWSSLWSNSPELCVSVHRKGELVVRQIEYKLLIDDMVVPSYEIEVTEGISWSYDLFAPPVDNICINYRDLVVGEHEVILLNYDVHTFQWILRHQSVIYVDSMDNITKVESVDA